MLNISHNRITSRFDESKYSAFSRTARANWARRPVVWLLVLMGLSLIILMLPWTQNASGKGKVTALLPSQRPQTLHSAIAGRIERWYVAEGDSVQKGDTLLFLSEVKSDYFDPALVDRTGTRVEAKEKAIRAYESKAQSMRQGISALREALLLKTQQQDVKILQLQFKIEADSAATEAAETAQQIARRQFDAQQQMYEEGIKSLTELEEKRQKLRESEAKYNAARNKLLGSRQELLAARTERENIRADYTEKIAKAESELYGALSSMSGSEEEKAKLETQLRNYQVRNGMYYVTAPQDGFVVRTLKTGLGEIIKEGESILQLMPRDTRLAVELYMEPMDMPLLSKGQQVRLQFDGWPALVFSGWPGVSTGTFGGKIYSVDRNISDNGKYRVLVEPDPEASPWPEALYVGAGAKGMALLQQVPVWYELWRQLNGFPPEYYDFDKEKEKAPKPKIKLK